MRTAIPPSESNFPPLIRRFRHGIALVEFAIVSLVFYILIAGLITFGFLLYAAQGLQTAADVSARELARMPFAADRRLDELVPFPADDLTPRESDMIASVFDEDWLVVDLDDLPAGIDLLRDLVPTWPTLNQQLFPLMIVDSARFEGGRRRLLRYPGAVVRTDRTADGLTVQIPLIEGRDPETGVETIRWVPVVEEILPPSGPGNFPPPGTPRPRDEHPFSITSPQRGLVALRINYPFQSPVMSGFRPSPDGPFEPNGRFVNEADDSGVSESNPLFGGDTLLSVAGGDDDMRGPFVFGSEGVPATFGGPYGLGTQQAFGRPVRPFRRVLTAQAIYRREVFGPPVSPASPPSPIPVSQP